MRTFRTLLGKELRMLLTTPSTYIAAVLFLFLMGIIYWTILKGFTMGPQEEPPATTFYRTFWLPAFFVVPLLTMRSITEERRSGTLETLLTTRASAPSIVGSKFIAAYGFYLLVWAITLSYPFIAAKVAPMEAAHHLIFDPAPMLGGMVFIALTGTVFIAIGLFSSSVTRSPLIAGMLTFTILFLFIAGSRLLVEFPVRELAWYGLLEKPLSYLQVFEHLLDFTRGVMDTRPFAYYLTHCLFFLGLTVIVLENRK